MEVVLKQFRWRCAQLEMSDNQIRLARVNFQEHATQHLTKVLSMDYQAWGREGIKGIVKQTRDFPLTWFDAFKIKFMGGFLAKIFGAQILRVPVAIENQFVCQHVDLDINDIKHHGDTIHLNNYTNNPMPSDKIVDWEDEDGD